MAEKITYRGTITVALDVSDMKAAVAWYRDMLGLGVAFEVPEVGWAEVHTPVEDVTIGLSQVEAVGASGGVRVVVGVQDIAAARRTLEGRGVVFDGETVTIEGMVKLATFRDRDGHRLMLAESLG
jgi:CreA protein